MTLPLPSEVYAELKRFLDFGDKDRDNLVALGPTMDTHASKITEGFYALLSQFPATAKHIDGRVDALKKTHGAWMKGLVGGDYGDSYLESRWRIGLAHVRIGLEPYWVEAVMSFIRTNMALAIASEIRDAAEAAEKQASFTKICDLDLLIINLSYGEDRLDRLTEFTGMKRALIENIIKIPRKA
ncbi:MAG: protoglobin domain-containing protein [Polyangiaceae bacterium]